MRRERGNNRWLYAEEKARAAERARQRLAEMRGKMHGDEGGETNWVRNSGHGRRAGAHRHSSSRDGGGVLHCESRQGSKSRPRVKVYGRVAAKVQADFAVLGKVNLLRRVSRQSQRRSS